MCSLSPWETGCLAGDAACNQIPAAQRCSSTLVCNLVMSTFILLFLLLSVRWTSSEMKISMHRSGNWSLCITFIKTHVSGCDKSHGNINFNICSSIFQVWALVSQTLINRGHVCFFCLFFVFSSISYKASVANINCKEIWWTGYDVIILIVFSLKKK